MVFSAYQEESFEGPLCEDFKSFVLENTDVSEEDLASFGTSTENELNIGGMQFADAITMGSEEIAEEVQAHFDASELPKLAYTNETDILIEYAKFIKNLTV